MDTDLPRLLTPSDVALWLSIQTSRVVRLAKQGKIPHRVLPTGDIVFDRDDLLRWLDSLRPATEVAHAC